MELVKNGTQPNSPFCKSKMRNYKTLNPQTRKKENKNIERMDFKEINALIESTREIKHNYSRSTTVTYVPLTTLQKITMIEEMNTVSSNKMMKYSGIFNEIKNQITDLSISLRSNFSEKKHNLKPKGSSRLAHYYNNNNQINEEQDEELISPFTQKTIHYPEDTLVIDETNLSEVDEQKNNIVLNTTQQCNIDNTKLFEKVKGKKMISSSKVLHNKKNNNQRKMNLLPKDHDRHREELLTNTNSNNLFQVKEDFVNTMNKSNLLLQSNDTSVIVESCQCITF